VSLTLFVILAVGSGDLGLVGLVGVVDALDVLGCDVP